MQGYILHMYMTKYWERCEECMQQECRKVWFFKLGSITCMDLALRSYEIFLKKIQLFAFKISQYHGNYAEYLHHCSVEIRL